MDQHHRDAGGLDVPIRASHAEDGGVDGITGGVADGADGEEGKVLLPRELENGVGLHIDYRCAGGAEEFGLLRRRCDEFIRTMETTRNPGWRFAIPRREGGAIVDHNVTDLKGWIERSREPGDDEERCVVQVKLAQSRCCNPDHFDAPKVR